MSRTTSRSWRRAAVWLHAASLLACTPSEVAGTQLLVRVEAAPGIAAKLKHVRAFWYPVAATDEASPTGALPFAVTGTEVDGGTNLTMLGSFGIAQGQQSRLRLVIKGYESSDPSAPAVIEQKAIVGFVPDQKATLTMSLMDACYMRASECSGLERTCFPVATGAVASGACGPVLEQRAVAEPPDDEPVRPANDGGTQVASSSGEKVAVTAISPTGHDRFFAVTYDSVGNIYAVGHTSAGVTLADDAQVVLAKFRSDGVLDPSFGTGGYAVTNIAVGGQNIEAARGIVIQRDGTPSAKIVVAGEAEHAPVAGGGGSVLARDTDIVLARFGMDGRLDATFGVAGIVRLDLGTGVAVSITLPDGGVQQALSGADSAWSLSQTADGKLVIHGASRATAVGSDGGVRTDNDFTLVRLTENGALDTTFAGTGVVRTDIGEVNNIARSATILPDNSIVGSGYTTSTVLGQNTQQPVLYKLKADGTPDTSFATNDQLTTPGLWHGIARSDGLRADAYGATPQGNKFVTVGYGPTPVSSNGSGTDWVFFRFNADGSQDKSFGTNGETFLDVAKFSDNGRAITTLPDNRILAVGGGRPAQPPAATAGQQPANSDGMVAVLSPNGQPDASFGAGGIRLFSWGNADFLHACAVAPSRKQVAVVGAAGGGTATTDDDDAVLILLPLP